MSKFKLFVKDITKCAPHLKSKTNKCYTKEVLVKIAKEINKIKKKKKEKLINLKQTKTKLWSDIEKYFEKSCNKDSRCWMKQPEIRSIVDKNMKLFTFRPKKPEEWKENKSTWLNNFDIKNTMIQVEKMYKNFKFFGPVPSDCPIDYRCELSDLDVFKLMKEKKDKIGIIYNLDVSTGPGTHWTSVFIDPKNSEINYYDSNGEMPIHYIKKFLEKTYKQMLKFQTNNRQFKKPIIIYNNKRHQYQDSECGMYSMYFILNRLDGKSMYQLSNTKISDKQMNELRDVLFD